MSPSFSSNYWTFSGILFLFHLFIEFKKKRKFNANEFYYKTLFDYLIITDYSLVNELYILADF